MTLVAVMTQRTMNAFAAIISCCQLWHVQPGHGNNMPSRILHPAMAI
jgi:hypothetical protein